MSPKKTTLRSRSGGKSSGGHARRTRVNKKRRSVRKDSEILELVRAGIKKFILEDATVEDFLKTIRVAGSDNKAHVHQLTRGVFTRILKEAIRERKRRTSR